MGSVIIHCNDTQNELFVSLICLKFVLTTINFTTRTCLMSANYCQVIEVSGWQVSMSLCQVLNVVTNVDSTICEAVLLVTPSPPGRGNYLLFLWRLPPNWVKVTWRGLRQSAPGVLQGRGTSGNHVSAAAATDTAQCRAQLTVSNGGPGRGSAAAAAAAAVDCHWPRRPDLGRRRYRGGCGAAHWPTARARDHSRSHCPDAAGVSDRSFLPGRSAGGGGGGAAAASHVTGEWHSGEFRDCK